MRTIEDRIIDMQVNISELLMKRWQIAPNVFVELDEKYKILWYLRLNYEPFHLTGDEGIAEEIEKFVQDQGGKW